MKIRASVRQICEKCRLIRRRGRIIVFVLTQNINNDKDNNSIILKTKRNFLKEKKC